MRANRVCVTVSRIPFNGQELEDMWDQWFAGRSIIRNTKGRDELSNGNIIVIVVRGARQPLRSGLRRTMERKKDERCLELHITMRPRLIYCTSCQLKTA